MLAEIFGVDGFIVLVVVAVLLFGGKTIPKLARNLGSAKNEFAAGLAASSEVTPVLEVTTPTVSSPFDLLPTVQSTGEHD